MPSARKGLPQIAQISTDFFICFATVYCHKEKKMYLFIGSVPPWQTKICRRQSKSVLICAISGKNFAKQITYFCGMGEISLQDAINQFLQKSKLKRGIQALRIEDVWEEVMGKTIAKYTDKIQIINTTLFITTNVAPLKNDFFFLIKQFIF